MTIPTDIPIRPVKSRRIPEEIIRQLKELIETEQIPPGGRLPPERKLAKMLGVSRPSLREALGTLDLLGIIELRHGSGTYVSLKPGEWHLHSIQQRLSIKKGTLIKIFEVREILEAGAARLAAERRTGDDLASMERAIEGMRLGLSDPDEFARHELDFHSALVEAADNVVMADLVEKLYVMVKGARQDLYAWLPPSDAFRRRDLLNHEKILDSIRARDKEGAVEAMVDHLRYFEETHLTATNEEDVDRANHDDESLG